MAITSTNISFAKPEVVEQCRERLSGAWEHDRDNRYEATKDLEFLAGKQWPDEVAKEREDQGRLLLTINRLPQFVRQVTNDIRQADVAIKVAPSDGAVKRAEQVIDPRAEPQQQPQGPQGPEGMEGQPPGMGHNGGPRLAKKPVTMAEVYNGLIREIQYQSSASLAYATAAEHQTSCGLGHFRILTQYMRDDAFDQEIRIEAVPHPLNVYWDPASVKQDRSDAMWCAVTEVLPRATFKARYPKAAEIDVEVNDDHNNLSLYWYSNEGIRVAEYWVKEPYKKQIGRLETGEVIELTKELELVKHEGAQFLATPEGEFVQILDTRDVDCHKVKQYVVSGSEILEGPVEWAGSHIPIIPVIGSEVPLEDKTLRYGLIRFARDPQMLYNYARTSAAESMAQAPKSPWLVTPAMIGPFKKVWDKANKALVPYLPYKPDPEAPGALPQRQNGPEIPSAYVQEAGISDGDIKATVGMYDPQLGQRSSETSGRAIMARDQQGDTGTFHYSDNLKFALEHAGRQLIELIPKIYDNERVIRILGEDDSELYVPINKAVGQDEQGEPVYINDLSVGRYDCRVKIGPSYATKRMESADSMMQFVQAVPDAAALVSDLIAKNMDWPGSDAIAERLKAAVPPEVLGEDGPPPPPPDPMAEQQQQMEMQMAQLTMAEKQAQIEKLQIENRKAGAEVDRIAAETEAKYAQAEKLQAETEILGYDRGEDAERYDIDRSDRLEQAEQSRADRLREFSMRQQPASNGSAQSGESTPNGV